MLTLGLIAGVARDEGDLGRGIYVGEIYEIM
jgi:hypothetical protein